MASRNRADGAVLVDGHAHFHHCFEGRSFFDEAARNFAAAAAQLNAAPAVTGVLLLAEPAHVDRFGEIKAAEGSSLAGGWAVAGTEEPFSLRLWRGGARLLLVAGSQIRTRERLEVLALGSRAKVADGLPFCETLENVVCSGALAVVPWGFGKWWGTRGFQAREAIRSVDNVVLGDIAGRPIFLGHPAPFRLAERLHRPILAGSDPLPFPSEVSRVASYGSVLSGLFDDRAPMKSLRQLLDKGSPLTFGSRQRMRSFLAGQARLRRRRGATDGQVRRA